MSGIINQFKDLTMFHTAFNPGMASRPGAPNGDKARETDNAADLKKACCDFESIFITQMLKAMRATVPKSGLLPDSNAMDLYTSMLDSQYASKISENGGIGLAEIIEHQMRNTGKT